MLETFPKHEIKKEKDKKITYPSPQSPSLKIKKEGMLETFPKHKIKKIKIKSLIHGFLAKIISSSTNNTKWQPGAFIIV